MVILSGGSVKLQFASADWTRCLDSWIELVASPVIEKLGNPLLNAPSISTIFVCVPSRLAQKILLLICFGFSFLFSFFLRLFVVCFLLCFCLELCLFKFFFKLFAA